MVRQVTAALQDGFAESHVTSVYDLSEGAAAVAAYSGAMSAGKVLISTGAEPLGLRIARS